MKKTHVLLFTFALMLVMSGIRYAQSYPPAGNDQMMWSSIICELEVILTASGNSSRASVRSEVAYLKLTAKGPTIIQRGDPYDPGDGRIKIDTEIVGMELVGSISGAALPGGSVLADVFESNTEKSSGAIQQLEASQDFPTESFFDIYLEIVFDIEQDWDGAKKLLAHEPIHVKQMINNIPPWEIEYPSDDGPFPLHNEQDELAGFIKNVTFNTGPEFPPGSIHLFGSAEKGWGFTADNITSPGPTITVNEGDLVNLVLTSVDVTVHNFVLDDPNGTIPNTPRSPEFNSSQTIIYQFNASVPGTFTYYSESHPDTMFGTFIVIWHAAFADINGDNVIDILDIAAVAAAFNTTPEDPRWNSEADLDHNGIINILDISACAIVFGDGLMGPKLPKSV